MGTIVYGIRAKEITVMMPVAANVYSGTEEVPKFRDARRQLDELFPDGGRDYCCVKYLPGSNCLLLTHCYNALVITCSL